MPDIYMDTDTALSEVPVNIMPLTDDGDFKTRETGVAHNAAGMDLVWNFVTTGGSFTQTAVTPTSGGNYDWTHQGDGMYTIEIPASGGASINNDTEGFGWFTGFATGVLPWRGPTIGFRPAMVNNSLVNGTDKLEVDVIQWKSDNVPVASIAGVPEVDVTHWVGGAVVAPTNTGYPVVDIQQVRGDTAPPLASGFFDANVSLIANNAITSAKIAADAIGASQLATDAVTEIQSGMATAANLATVAGYLDTEIAAILADTNELQTDWANGGRLDLILDARASQVSVDTIDDFLDTEVAAIKAKTDQLTFTTANQVDAGVIDKTDFELATTEHTNIADALLKRDWAAVSGAAARSVLNALRFLRNKRSIVAGVLHVKEEDDSSDAWTANLTTDSGASPITDIDPT